MSAGAMNRYLRIRIPALTDDGEGGQSVTWTNGPFVFAEKLPATAREQAIAGALQTIASHVLRMHYDERVSVDRRLAQVSPAGPELQILGVRDPDGHRWRMEVDCAEVV